MNRAIRGLPGVSLAVGMLALPVQAINQVEKCESGKNKVAGKYAFCRQKAEALAIQKGLTTPDYSKCDAKFSGKWGKVEASGEGLCPTNGDLVAMQAFITDHATAVAVALGGGGLPTCDADLATCTTSLGTCNSSLTTCDGSLATCDGSLTTCSGSLTTCTGSLAVCTGDLSSREADLAEAEANLAAYQPVACPCFSGPATLAGIMTSYVTGTPTSGFDADCQVVNGLNTHYFAVESDASFPRFPVVPNDGKCFVDMTTIIDTQQAVDAPSCYVSQYVYDFDFDPETFMMIDDSADCAAVPRYSSVRISGLTLAQIAACSAQVAVAASLIPACAP